ncbi:MAG: ribonuclease H-like domain-containing protein [Polyangiaceae bacterium]
MSVRTRLSRLGSARSSNASVGFAVGSGGEAARKVVLDELRDRIRSTIERTAQRAGPPPIETADLPFSTVETSDGPLHVRTQRLSAAHRTGRVPIACGVEADADLIALLALDPAFARCDFRQALFLDTETTGLAGGTGTVAFLVGLAWWESGATLVLEQLLVRSLGQEAPMLRRVHARVAAASTLVTFNGKSFDMPLLRTRFVMARMQPLSEPPHLDLLHLARRIHGKRIPQGCRLVALERALLGFERVDDVASGDVSALYLHFLRTGDSRALMGVIDHNAWDVVAMAALLGLYGAPLESGLAADDLAGVARAVHRAGALVLAGEFAQAAVERQATAETLRTRGHIAKARGDRARALADFEAHAAKVDDPSVRLELAKLYEHWLRAPHRALEHVQRGTGESPDKTQRRFERLERKTRQFKLDV